MKFEFDNSPMPFNPKRGAYILIALSFSYLSFFLYLSVRDYRAYLPHEVEVNYYKHKIKSEERNIDNGILRTNAKTTFIIKSKNYFQYFILELYPEQKKKSMLFFSINFFIISIIITISNRKSSKEKIFTKELLAGLNILKIYIFIMLNCKIALLFYISSYIRQLSNNEVGISFGISSEVLLFSLVSIFAIFITYVKKGIELQMEKDLTI